MTRTTKWAIGLSVFAVAAVMLKLAASLVSILNPTPILLPFPPKNTTDLQRFVSVFGPMDFAPSTQEVKAVKVPSSSSDYAGLSTYYFAYRCDQAGAAPLFRYTNAVHIKVPPLTIGRDPKDGERELDFHPPETPTHVFPDMFYRVLDLSHCDTLLIRMKGAPTWYEPDLITNGLAERLWWGRGHGIIEMYYNADTEMMYLRLDELRPY